MENSKIEWCDHTFNPWIGCAKISKGCENCYAETMMDKRFKKVKWGPRGTRVRTTPQQWRQVYKWDRQANPAQHRPRVFCASLADVFEDRPELSAWRAPLFHLINQCRNLDFLLLTKRPENALGMIRAACLTSGWDVREVSDFNNRLAFHFPNIWIGVSVEDQENAAVRIPRLCELRPKVRFLSLEPLLGPVDISGWLAGGFLDWVIVGGESGHGARPMRLQWVRSIRDQCQQYNVPFLFKQWGDWVPASVYHANDSIDPDAPHYFSGHSSAAGMREFVHLGKTAAGRELDHAFYDDFPNVCPWPQG